MSINKMKKDILKGFQAKEGAFAAVKDVFGKLGGH